MSFILNVALGRLLIPTTAGLPSGLVSYFAWHGITQFSDQVKVKYTSQFVNGMSSVVHKLFKCFNCIRISIFFFFYVVTL